MAASKNSGTSRNWLLDMDHCTVSHLQGTFELSITLQNQPRLYPAVSSVTWRLDFLFQIFDMQESRDSLFGKFEDLKQRIIWDVNEWSLGTSLGFTNRLSLGFLLFFSNITERVKKVVYLKLCFSSWGIGQTSEAWLCACEVFVVFYLIPCVYCE